MVDSKLSALAPAAAPADTDLFYTVQGGVSLKQTALALKSYAGAMSIGEAIVGGTSPQLLYVGPGSVLAQMANLPTSYLNSGTGANGSTFWRGDGAWGPAVAWVPYTGPPQSFLAQQMTRDGDWTMVANTNTNDRPAPQATGDEVDLLPPWTPAVLNARATYTVVNEWTLSQSGWINQYGIDVIAQNVGATHTITLKVNGTIKDTFTSVPSTSELYMHDITPIVAVSGAVIDVTLQVTMIPPNNQMYWYQQPGLFATAPTYTSLAQGSKDGGAMSTTAYGCHLTFIPGTVSPDWDIVAFGGSAAGGAPAGGGVSIGDAVIGGTANSVLFVGSGGVLAQDNAKFFWDDANERLSIGSSGSTTSALYIDTLPAFFEMPNASGNNWFAGNAGNFTLTGSGNFGTGDGSLGKLTTGIKNLAVGFNACYNVTSGRDNVGMGNEALSAVTTGSRNCAIGSEAGLQLTTGTDNFLMGMNAGSLLTTGSSNCAIGTNSLGNCSGGAQSNVALGNTALGALTSGNYNTGAGVNAGTHFASGAGNLFLGAWSGFNITGGNYNTIVGGWSGPSASISNIIAICNMVDSITVDDGKVRGVDYGYTNANAWSFQYLTTPVGLHVYNTTDSLAPPTNYERAVLDWNVTSNVLTIGTQAGGTGVVRPIRVYSEGIPMLFGDAALKNYFTVGAGNFTATGSGNMGTGISALANLSSGNNNMAMGQYALLGITSGGNNLGIGGSALQNATTTSNNIALGTYAMESYNDTGAQVAIGGEVFYNMTIGASNTGIGYFVGHAIDTYAYSNTFIGANSAQNMKGSGSSNVFIGASSGINITGYGNSNNTIIGCWQGPSASMSNCIVIAYGNTLAMDYNYTNAGTWTFSAPFLTTPVAVASLPTVGQKGRKHFVTDATVTTFGTVVAGGGANNVPVYDDGTNWRIG